MPRDSASPPWWTRPLPLAAAALIIMGTLVVARCARTDRTGDAASATSAVRPGAEAPVTPTPSIEPAADSDAAETASLVHRSQAVTAAIDAVHDYLQAVGARDFEKADALWQTNRQPATHDEAGLRELGPLHALRIQNQAPELPPGNEVPMSLEIPVMLVASPESGGAIRLHGHYRVRRDAVRARWEIAAASLTPVIR